MKVRRFLATNQKVACSSHAGRTANSINFQDLAENCSSSIWSAAPQKPGRVRFGHARSMRPLPATNLRQVVSVRRNELFVFARLRRRNWLKWPALPRSASHDPSRRSPDESDRDGFACPIEVDVVARPLKDEGMVKDLTWPGIRAISYEGRGESWRILLRTEPPARPRLAAPPATAPM